MGACCSQNRFQRAYQIIAKANRELQTENKRLVQLKQQIRIVEHKIDQFDVEQMFEEADISERELKLLKQDAHKLICKNKHLRKQIQELKNQVSRNRQLQIQNQINQERITILDQTKNLLMVRKRDQETLEEQNNENRTYLYEDEIIEEQQAYSRKRNQASIVFPKVDND